MAWFDTADARLAPQPPELNVQKIRRDFPILSRHVHGKPLVYLDNAATCQKPQAVINALVEAYSGYYANIHRGVHRLSEESTRAYESARKTVQAFLNAREAREIVFVRGATEAINLVAQSWARLNLRAGDEIILTTLEHHSNIVPWQRVRDEQGVVLRVVPVTDDGELVMSEFSQMLGPRTKLVAVTHVSNALGTINPIADIIKQAKDHGARVLIDGAQAVAHMPVDVRALGCDFYVFSGHKLYGPTGIGVLYAPAELLESMPPYQLGGDMIRSVQFERTTFNDVPYKFEAGTPNITGAIGLAAAIEYVKSVGLAAIAAHEARLVAYGIERLGQMPGIRLIGRARERASVLSFDVEGVHPHDVGTLLDQQGIAIRTGHHCCQPLMERLDVPATARASFAMYNTIEEVDVLASALEHVQRVFA